MDAVIDDAGGVNDDGINIFNVCSRDDADIGHRVTLRRTHISLAARDAGRAIEPDAIVARWNIAEGIEAAAL